MDGLRLCKLGGCTNELDNSDPTRGIWANICSPCRRGDTPPGVLYRESRGIGTGRVDAAPKMTVPAGALASKARAIVPLAQKLERKVEASKRAKTESVTAVKEFSAALIELREAAQALLSGPVDS